MAYNQNYATQILQALQAGPLAPNDIATATGLAQADVDEQLAIMADPANETGTQMVSEDAMSGEFTALIPPPAPAAAADLDDTVIDAIINEACTPCPTAGACVNEIKKYVDASGRTLAEVVRGLDAAQRLSSGLRCQGLRDKLQAAGINLADLDSVLDAMDGGLDTAKEVMAHYGDAPI